MKTIVPKKLLHVGCGPKTKAQTTPGFNTDAWHEIRVDIDPTVSPDVTGSMTDLSEIASGSIDAVYSSHNIEHLYAHEVPVALKEFFRVLNEEGFLIVTCPDLQSVCALVANNKLTEPAYISPAGPIAPIDILYGHRPQIARGNLFMSHRSGFTQKVLNATLKSANFASVASMARGYSPHFDLWAVATKARLTEADIRTLAGQHFPPPALSTGSSVAGT